MDDYFFTNTAMLWYTLAKWQAIKQISTHVCMDIVHFVLGLGTVSIIQYQSKVWTHILTDVNRKVCPHFYCILYQYHETRYRLRPLDIVISWYGSVYLPGLYILITDDYLSKISLCKYFVNATVHMKYCRRLNFTREKNVTCNIL